ncbi:MAG TPA: DUF1295 domain-containing protein, partial [Bacteroidales bacterium]|nr:DUF1295 domain-containing protein [Bacteroidales bacterium]
MLHQISFTGLINNYAGGDTDLAGLVYSWVYVFAAAVLICFLVGEITRNYSQTDKLWSLMPLIYGSMAIVSNPFSIRLWLMVLLVSLWGLRLSYNFYRKGGYNLIPWKGEEDYRWKIMREHPLLRGRLRFGMFNLLFISFYQHFLILLFSSPFLLVAKDSAGNLSVIDLIAASFMLFFIILETVADNQQFRFQKAKRGIAGEGYVYLKSLEEGFLSEGLWGYMRHPNFMAEQGIWISFYFFGVAATGKWINWTLAGPVLLVLLFRGSTQLTEKISSV